MDLVISREGSAELPVRRGRNGEFGAAVCTTRPPSGGWFGRLYVAAAVILLPSVESVV